MQKVDLIAQNPIKAAQEDENEAMALEEEKEKNIEAEKKKCCLYC